MTKRQVGHIWFLLLGPVVVALLVLFPRSCMDSRERARRITCSNYMKQIGLAMQMYAGDHDNAYPQRLVDLGPYMNHQARPFCCPGTGNRPGDFATVDDWTDYVYVSGLADTASPDTVLMYCPAENHRGEGGNVLFVASNVEWFNSERTEQYGETVRSLGEVIGTIGKGDR